MGINIRGRSFLTLLDYPPEEITQLLDLAARLKEEKKNGVPHPLCRGKNIALLFEKTSTRTRCAFEVAAADLGMHSTYLDPSGSQIGKKEKFSHLNKNIMIHYVQKESVIIKIPQILLRLVMAEIQEH